LIIYLIRNKLRKEFIMENFKYLILFTSGITGSLLIVCAFFIFPDLKRMGFALFSGILAVINFYISFKLNEELRKINND